MSDYESSSAIVIQPPRLPYHPLIEERFGIDKSSWKALVEAIFPNASSVESVILALSYCRARKLDPFKRNVHIVAIWDKNRKCMVDSVWPGIGELRTTAFRTGEYAGRDDAEFGNVINARVGEAELSYPEWCRVTVHRMIKGERRAFAGPKVYWLETYATAKRDTDTPNEMWATRVYGQIEKCAEAAALRAAFPEEIGSDMIGDEIRGSVVGVSTPTSGSESTTDQVRRLSAQSLADKLKARETPQERTPEATAAQSTTEYAPEAQNAGESQPGAADAASEDPEQREKAVYDYWYASLTEIAGDDPVRLAMIKKNVSNLILKKGLVGKEWKLPEADRKIHLVAARDQSGNYAAV